MSDEKTTYWKKKAMELEAKADAFDKLKELVDKGATIISFDKRDIFNTASFSVDVFTNGWKHNQPAPTLIDAINSAHKSLIK